MKEGLAHQANKNGESLFLGVNGGMNQFGKKNPTLNLSTLINEIYKTAECYQRLKKEFSSQPSLPSLIVFHVPVTPFSPHSRKSEIKFLDVLIIFQFFCWSIQYDSAVFHDITIL